MQVQNYDQPTFNQLNQGRTYLKTQMFSGLQYSPITFKKIYSRVYSVPYVFKFPRRIKSNSQENVCDGKICLTFQNPYRADFLAFHKIKFCGKNIQ